MKHIIIGTAGHIDHGKTTLIKALTGRNTDRLKEERERGISIELGFTYFDLPNGQRAGIIDVPGHEKFIKNMLAGVIGIDIVLLVIAADEGIMPQTLEHLAILDLLGIKKGFIVLTKTDLVDEEWIQLVEEDIHNEIEDTFLKDSPIVRVSSTKGNGVEDVISLINQYAMELEDREVDEMPRLPVDRVFSISGFGTVVTGTLLSGKFEVGDEVQIFPGDTIGRIRNLQVHDKDSNVAYAGQRVAINIAGIKKEYVHRGSVIATVDSMKDTMMLDVKVKLLKSIDRFIENRTRLKLYIGTEEVLCRMILLDKDELHPNEEAYAQLRLEEKIVAKRGDRFILRFYSPMFTIGGGEILDPNPDKKKRYDDDSIEELKILETGDPKHILEEIIKNKSKDFLTSKEIIIESSLKEDDVNGLLKVLEKDNRIIIFILSKDLYPIHIDFFNKIKSNIISELDEFHSRFPLRAGMPKEELRSKYLRNAKPKLSDLFMDRLKVEGIIELESDLIKLKGYNPAFTENQNKLREKILDNYKNYLPMKNEDLAKELNVKIEKFEEVFNALINNGEIIRLSKDIYLSTENYKKALDILKEYITKNGSITIAEFRDLINTNRKIALGLLEYFDQVKLTKREGEKRVLV